MGAFILSHFSYCTLLWIFYNRALNHKINHIHERALRIAFKDYKNDLDFLLQQSTSVPINVRSLQLLLTKCGLNPLFMKEIFMQRNISFSIIS